MNITGQKKHLKTMKSMLNKQYREKEKDRSSKRVTSLEKNIPNCQTKIKNMKEILNKKRNGVVRKSIKGRNPKGRRRMFASKE